MSITIDGSTDTITGLSAGGLPDNSITTNDIANGAVTASKLSGGQSGAAPVYGCRAWCVFNGTTVGTNAPIAGGNVTNVTRNGTGDYTINFTTALPSANYCVTGSVQDLAASNFISAVTIKTGTTPTTTSVTVRALGGAGTSNTVNDTPLVSVAIFC